MSDDDQVFEAVRALFEAGEYVDYRVDEPRILTHLGETTTEPLLGHNQFSYHRGTPQYRLAVEGGYLRPLPTPTPVPVAAVLECESVIGARLPNLLRRCYLELGNGGFGPNMGILGLRGGLSVPGYRGGGTVAEQWLSWRHSWPAPLRLRLSSLVPICEWGCNIVSFIDVSDPEYRMWGFEPNGMDHEQADGALHIKDLETALYREEFGFTEWLHRWTEGTLHQPYLVLDKDTDHWRGPTDADGHRSRLGKDESWTVTLTDPPF